MHGLQSLIEKLEQDGALSQPDRLRQRLDALDRLDACLLDEQLATVGVPSIETDIYPRARALCDRLEVANFELYQSIRCQIQQAAGPYRLLQWAASQSDPDGDASSPVNGEGYDYLDELITGILQFEKPEAGKVELTAEMVFYQPTPARHIFDLIGRIALTERDVLVDLGSGLGHVPLLASICTGARSIGVELETGYVDCARQSAQALNLENVTFFQQDARKADLSRGTVFYLYTPFTGSILRDVLDSLRREAAGRAIRICTFGPCTATVAEESWLEPVGAFDPNRIAIFRSRN
jgi:Histone methylation protein DOT1